uniref:CST complex subunit STN1 n=1 Tax=Graphocephala atropunctata TaxID=36148 RepID=A0A1B6LE94_9HEMI
MLQCGELDQSGYVVTVKDGPDNIKQPSEHSDVEIIEKGREPELKLWICDLLNINKSGGNENTYYFHGIPVNIVNVYAVITSVSKNRFGVLYNVDDGTGEICCWQSHKCVENSEGLKKDLASVTDSILGSYVAAGSNDSCLVPQAPGTDQDDTPKSAIVQASHWMKTQILAHLEVSCDLPKVGDTVQLRGKLCDFRGERCIVIYNMRPVYDINEETDRRFELIHLYETFYSTLET